MPDEQLEEWDLWYPKAAATGMPFARGRVGRRATMLLVHAPPPVLAVTVRDASGLVLAAGSDLDASGETPIARLTRQGKRIVRDDIWPSDADIGLPVLLPGGEVGILKQWWHAADHSEWRWQIELYNRVS